MQPDVKSRAKARFNRAWAEATHLFNQRSTPEKELLQRYLLRFSTVAKTLDQAFSQLEENPCASCGRCCTKAAFNAGFFSHEERQALISSGVSLDEYLVEEDAWHGYEEPPERCLFLTPNGCNIPASYRSSTCVKYVCQDRLGPALSQAGLEGSYWKSMDVLDAEKLQLTQLSRIPFASQPLGSFGHG